MLSRVVNAAPLPFDEHSFVIGGMRACGQCDDTYLRRLHEYFSHATPAHYSDPDWDVIQHRILPVSTNSAHDWYKNEIMRIMHSFCEHQPKLNFSNQKTVTRDCRRLIELYNIVSKGIDDFANPLFVAIAKMTREQLAMFGLFDSQSYDNEFVREKILWTELTAHKLALEDCIGDEKHTNAQFAYLAQLCYMLACVIEMHLTSLAIQQNTISEKCVEVGRNDIYGHCDCGVCDGTARSHANETVHEFVYNYAPLSLCSDTELFLGRCFKPRALQRKIKYVSSCTDESMSPYLAHLARLIAYNSPDDVQQDEQPRRLQPVAEIHSDIWCIASDDVQRDEQPLRQQSNAKRAPDVVQKDEQPRHRQPSAEIRDPHLHFIA